MRTLLHISDIHFGPKHLADRAESVRSLVSQRRPDFVVISGDVTQRATRGQFCDARRFVDSLGVPTLVLPGNHDVPLYRAWERVFAPFSAYRKYFSDDLEPQLGDDQVILAAINTAFNWTFTEGRIRLPQLEKAVGRFVSAPASAYRIAVVHHHLLPPPDGRAKRVVRGAARALHGLSEAGVDLVLAGHLHRSFMARVAIGGNPSDPGMVVLHVGTTTSSRGRTPEVGQNTAHWIQIGPQAVEVASLRWEEEGFVVRKQETLPRRPRNLSHG